MEDDEFNITWSPQEHREQIVLFAMGQGKLTIEQASTIDDLVCGE